MDMDTISLAFDALRKTKGMKLRFRSCALRRDADVIRGDALAWAIPGEGYELTITATAGESCETEIDYLIFGRDLEDGSEVDRFVGHTYERLGEEERRTLRLIWILGNGYRYAVDGIQSVERIEEGWRPRVAAVRRSLW